MPLIIDDNATDLFVLSQLLTREGSPLPRSDRLADLKPLIPTLGPVDVIFLDLEMPTINGYDLQPWLRAQLGNVPMIAHSAHMYEIGAAPGTGLRRLYRQAAGIEHFPQQLARIRRGEAVWDRI